MIDISVEEFLGMMAFVAVLAYLLGMDHGKQVGWRRYADLIIQQDEERAAAVRRAKAEELSRNQ